MPQTTNSEKQPADDGVAIWGAIVQRRWLQFRIGSRTYVVEPHAYGVMPEGNEAVLAWHLLIVRENGSVGLLPVPTLGERCHRSLARSHSLPRISSSSRKPCPMPIMPRPPDVSATIIA
jgi:hypothetical protein